MVGTLLVALLIWMDFRSLSRTLAALAPLTVGLIWMVGGMVAVNTPMNFINIFVTTMIIGIGVDYGVHILHRFQEVQDFPREEFEKGIVETGKAVVAASVSTIFGFGSMMFSSLSRAWCPRARWRSWERSRPASSRSPSCRRS